jgi:hypothetical protein
MQGINWPAGTTALAPSVPSVVGVNSDRSMRTGDQPFAGTRQVDLSGDTTFAAGASPRAIYIGTAGNLKIDMLDIDGVTVLTGKTIVVTDFQLLPFASIRKIYSTANGTTASNLVIGS